MDIQLPVYEHIDQILALNYKYLLSHLTDEQRQNGFVRVEYNKDDIKRIIDNREMVIALDDKTIIGYYLIGKTSLNNGLNYQLEKVTEVFKEPFLVDKVGYGAQAIIETAYRGQNVLNLMLDSLIALLGNRYNVLFSSVTKINGNALKAHTKGGYKLLDEDDTKYYVGLFIDEL